MWYLLTILIAAICITNVHGNCKICNANGVSCISETDFNLCFAGIVDATAKYTCPTDYVCTASTPFCAPKTSNPTIACVNSCNECKAGRGFACTSRTTFALCTGVVLTDVKGVCPNSLVCDTSTNDICVESCKVDSLVCDVDPPTPPPTAAPPTAAPTPAPAPGPTLPTPAPTPAPTLSPSALATQVCVIQNTIGRFPYTNDNGCRNYVYCRYSGSSLVGTPSTCPGAEYFNKNTQNCEATKPSWCA